MSHFDDDKQLIKIYTTESESVLEKSGESSGSDAQGGYSVFQVAISIVSTIIGGGIVSVPYAMTAPGLANGILINTVIMILIMFTTHLYLSARDILGYDSISELSYICFGRVSVFMINILVAFVIFGILTLYMILFSRITLSLVDFWKLYQGADISTESPSAGSQQSGDLLLASAFHQKVLCILCVTAILLPFLFKKSLKELKIQSQILFIGVILLLLTFVLKQFDTGDFFEITLPATA